MSNDKNIINNIAHLLVFQGTTFLIPLLIIPYLARVLGVNGLGLLGFSLAFTQYFFIFIEYGFNLSATAQTAKIKENFSEVNEFFWLVIFTKLILFFLGFIVMCFIVLMVPKLNNIKELIFISYTIAIGSIFFPIWFLQGIERMEIIAVYNIIGRITSLLLIFLFVKSALDLNKLLFIYSVTALIPGVFVLMKLKKEGYIGFPVVPKLTNIWSILKDGWYYFISVASVSLYSNTNMVILGFMGSSSAIGYYAGTEKIKTAIVSLTSPFTQAIYPRVNALMKKDTDEALNFVAKYFVIFCMGSLVYSILIFILSPVIVKLLLGDDFIKVVNNLRVISILPLLVVMNNFYGTQLLLPFGLKKEFMQILIFSGIFNISILIPLITLYQDLGVCIAIVITEFLVTALMYRKVKSRIKGFNPLFVNSEKKI